jgi:hypothetical protein
MRGGGTRCRSVETERGGGAFVALRHAQKNSPQRQAATTGERAVVPPYGVLASRRLPLSHSHI